MKSTRSLGSGQGFLVGSSSSSSTSSGDVFDPTDASLPLDASLPALPPGLAQCPSLDGGLLP